MQQAHSSQHAHLIRRPSHLSQVTPWIAPPSTSERISFICICRERFEMAYTMAYAIDRYIRYCRKFPTSGPRSPATATTGDILNSASNSHKIMRMSSLTGILTTLNIKLQEYICTALLLQRIIMRGISTFSSGLICKKGHL